MYYNFSYRIEGHSIYVLEDIKVLKPNGSGIILNRFIPTISELIS
jgi:hypothetical protein